MYKRQVLERNAKPGKKLLATGNGRCNLDNTGIAPEQYFTAGPAALRPLPVSYTHLDVYKRQNHTSIKPAKAAPAKPERLLLLSGTPARRFGRRCV